MTARVYQPNTRVLTEPYNSLTKNQLRAFDALQGVPDMGPVDITTTEEHFPSGLVHVKVRIQGYRRGQQIITCQSCKSSEWKDGFGVHFEWMDGHFVSGVWTEPFRRSYSFASLLAKVQARTEQLQQASKPAARKRPARKVSTS